jgi:hypothetical protein
MPLLVAQPMPISVCCAICSSSSSTRFSSALPAPDAGSLLLFDDLVLGDGEDTRNDDPEVKLEWLRSQIIGAEAEFSSPFGTRRLTYADHTASGRCLQFVEEFVQQNILPYYGDNVSTRYSFFI